MTYLRRKIIAALEFSERVLNKIRDGGTFSGQLLHFDDVKDLRLPGFTSPHQSPDGSPERSPLNSPRSPSLLGPSQLVESDSDSSILSVGSSEDSDEEPHADVFSWKKHPIS